MDTSLGISIPDLLRCILTGQEVISMPGIPQGREGTPASRLLAEEVPISGAARVLLLGCGQGALAVVLARRAPQSHFTLMDVSAPVLARAKEALQAGGITHAVVHREIAPPPGPFDLVVMELPRGRDLARRWLVSARDSLAPGGYLYLAGSNSEGIQPVARDAAALFGDSLVLRVGERNRVIRSTRQAGIPEPDWAREAGIAPGTWHEFEVEMRGETFHIRSLPGIFSYNRLDDGSRLLLSVLTVPPGARVLDIGCGYGIIGLFAARLGAARVDMVDSNLLAIAAARENLARNLSIAKAPDGGSSPHAPIVEALPGDALESVRDRRYDLVVTNPPFHSGSAVDYDAARIFMEDARKLLAPGGRFVLVANRFIPYQDRLRDLYPRVERLAEDNRYHVWAATRS